MAKQLGCAFSAFHLQGVGFPCNGLVPKTNETKGTPRVPLDPISCLKQWLRNGYAETRQPIPGMCYELKVHH